MTPGASAPYNSDAPILPALVPRMSAHVLSPGTLFAGRYKVERCVGSGGMGAVYEAEHLDTERRVALKVMLPQALVTEGHIERFRQEARVAGRIRHPNIVDVLDAGVDETTRMPYLVMELLRGEDLGSRIDNNGPMTPEEAIVYLKQTASALDCLHDRSIVHRDLKPENLFLTWGPDNTPTVKILDFGVAKVIADGNSAAFTQDAHGTPVYMAPEQFAEQIRISPATDIYALGMLAFTLLTGTHYWGVEVERGMNVFMLARIAEAGPKQRASERAARAGVSLSPAFDDWFSTCTAIAPHERYPTATDAVEALAEALNISIADARLPPTRPPAVPRLSVAPRPPPAAPASTPPIPLARAYPFWRRPSVIMGLLIGVSLVVATGIVVKVAPFQPSSAPSSSSAGASGADPGNEPPGSTPSGASTGRPGDPAAIPSTTSSASAQAPLPTAATATASAVAPPATPSRPTGPVPTGSKRPLYSRE